MRSIRAAGGPPTRPDAVRLRVARHRARAAGVGLVLSKELRLERLAEGQNLSRKIPARHYRSSVTLA
eukprot:9486481-Pyramimonas_sp.AAC.1